MENTHGKQNIYERMNTFSSYHFASPLQQTGQSLSILNIVEVVTDFFSFSLENTSFLVLFDD